jgi:hypothetical protein
VRDPGAEDGRDELLALAFSQARALKALTYNRQEDGMHDEQLLRTLGLGKPNSRSRLRYIVAANVVSFAGRRTDARSLTLMLKVCTRAGLL